MTTRTATLLALCLSALPALAQEPPSVPRWGRFELPLARDGVATFTAPSGRVDRVGAFPARGAFRVRWAPREVGLHRYEVRALSASGAVTRTVLARGEVRATRSAARGVVRVDPTNPWRLVHEDGTPLLVLGENRMNVYDPAWNHGEVGIDEYVVTWFDDVTRATLGRADVQHQGGALLLVVPAFRRHAFGLMTPRP